MKKLFFLGIILTVGITFLSCQKTSTPPNSTVANIAQTNHSGNEASPMSSRTPTIGATDQRLLFLSFDRKICFCIGSGGSCLPEVTVTSTSTAERIRLIIQTIETDDQSAIRTAFDNNKVEMIEFISEPYLNGILNGDLTAHNATDAEGLTKFIILRNSNTDEVVATYPFKF